MSAPSESATSPSPCACTNISLMQLFHELKQKFPGVPDHVVSNTIELYCHDKQACETHLHREVKASLTHAYHASSSAAARQLSELKLNPPGKCRNQPITKHELIRPTAIKSQSVQGPQSATLSSSSSVEDEVETDDNQNVLEPKTDENQNLNPSPITVINIDNCYAKYSAESPSDFELTNDNLKQEQVSTSQKNLDQPESTNYRILKSNKIRSNLHERLEKNKEKKTVKKVDEPPSTEESPPEKPKRPNTLNFIKPNPDIAFKHTLKEPEDTFRSVSPAPQKSESSKEAKSFGASKPEYGYPLNVSVKVNCHMDLSRGYGDPWLDDYDSPRAITSVNLTVCTPTSNMASPIRDSIDEEEGLDGHVTVTVSPSTARAPRRRAPPPPPSQGTRLESPRPSRSAPEPPGTEAYDRSLIERQMERLSLLAKTLAQDKARLAQMNRETQILAAPPPTPSQAQQLRDYVEKLRQQCTTLSKRLELTGNEQSESGNFYSNIYTGQRPPATAPWECHMCTFLNHPLLDKCEECTMPRIFIGTSSLSRTHDSGFGSFRDRDRNIRSDGRRTELDGTSDLVENSCALNLNC